MTRLWGGYAANRPPDGPHPRPLSLRRRGVAAGRGEV